VLELIERKAAGEEIAVQVPSEEPQAVPDLMAALESSLAAAKGDQKKAPAKPAAKSRNGAAPKDAAPKGGASKKRATSSAPKKRTKTKA